MSLLRLFIADTCGHNHTLSMNRYCQALPSSCRAGHQCVCAPPCVCTCVCMHLVMKDQRQLFYPEADPCRILEEEAGLQVVFKPHILGSLGASPPGKLRFHTLSVVSDRFCGHFSIQYLLCRLHDSETIHKSLDKNKPNVLRAIQLSLSVE